MNKKRFIGFILALAGILISFSKVALTGAVIGIEKSSVAEISGALLTIFGVALILVAYHEEKAGLEKKIVRTARFEESIRKYDPALIEQAIEKIGSGAGREEYLRHIKKRSIRVSHGARILFEREADGTVVLEEYLPSSRHY